MSIAWKGLGWLSLVIPAVLAFIVDWLMTDATPVHTGLAAMVGAVIAGFLGQSLNSEFPLTFTDRETGVKTMEKYGHGFMWIRMEYASVLIFLIGLGAFIEGWRGADSMIGMSTPLIILIGYGFYQFEKRRGSKHTFNQNSKDMGTADSNDQKTMKGDAKVNEYIKSKKSTVTVGGEAPHLRLKTQQDEFAEIRNKKIEPLNIDPADHSKYLPKK